MNVKWSQTAQINYRQNLHYLLEEYGYKVMKEFIEIMIKTVEKIIEFPELGAYDKDIGCRKILVVKQIYLFYEINNGELNLLDVWNNYKKPYWY